VRQSKLKEEKHSTKKSAIKQKISTLSMRHEACRTDKGGVGRGRGVRQSKLAEKKHSKKRINKINIYTVLKHTDLANGKVLQLIIITTPSQSIQA